MKSKRKGTVVFFNKKKKVGIVVDESFEDEYVFHSDRIFHDGDEVEFTLEESNLSGMVGVKTKVAFNIHITKHKEEK